LTNEKLLFVVENEKTGRIRHIDGGALLAVVGERGIDPEDQPAQKFQDAGPPRLYPWMDAYGRVIGMILTFQEANVKSKMTLRNMKNFRDHLGKYIRAAERSQKATDTLIRRRPRVI
jgi:hypothetical protein